MIALSVALLVGLSALVSGAEFKEKMRYKFDGAAGQSVDTSVWNIMTDDVSPHDLNANEEVHKYTTSTDNIQLSGNSTLRIIPRKSADGQWTSARIEGKPTFTPEEGKIMRFESRLRFGDAPEDKSKGIWPAVWMLGDSFRKDTVWPLCGELDIMERKNGEGEGHGTPHCGEGNPCGGFTEHVALPDTDWHTWAIEVDRTDSNWEKQVIRWYFDDNNYNAFTGGEIKNEDTWKSVAHSPLFFILNVAVGGRWPGNPDDQTADGEASMMEVEYISVSST